MSLRDGYRYEQNLTVELSQHPDSKEAVAASWRSASPFSGADLAAHACILSITHIAYTDRIVLCRLGETKRPHGTAQAAGGT